MRTKQFNADFYLKIFNNLSTKQFNDDFHLNLNDNLLNPELIIFINKYTKLQKINSGGFGDVFLVVNKNTKKKCVMKVIKKNVNVDFKKEVTILEKLKKNNNISEIYDYKFNENYMIIIMEYIEGKELFEYINKYLLKEDIVKNIFYKILCGMKYIHDNNIIHKDIKPENILVNNIFDENCVVKIIDFGLADFCDDFITLDKICGSCEYIAPEVYQKKYNKKSDIFSLGIILYTMLCGEHPLYTSENKIKNTKIFSEERWRLFNNIKLKNLIKRMLSINYENRPSIDEIIEHDWFKEKQNILQNTQSNNKTLTHCNTPNQDYSTPQKNYITPDKKIIKKKKEEKKEKIKKLLIKDSIIYSY